MEGETSSKTSTLNQENGSFTLTASDSSVLSTNGLSLENTKLMVFPNPAKENVSISLSNNIKIEQVEVYSILGDKIITQKSIDTSNKFTVNISGLASGVYFIKAKTENGILSRKMIKR
jgi:hypothetical protein